MIPTTTRPEARGLPHPGAARRRPAARRLLFLRGPYRDYAAPFAVLLLLYAGFFKADPLLSWVPVDLTLLGAVLTLTAIVAALLSNSVPRGTGVVLALWATFMPMAILHADNPYGSTKTLHLVTLTLLAALAPLFLIRSRRRQEIWVLMQIALGTVLAIGTYLAPVPELPPYEIYRMALDGSNPIGDGRAAGVAVVGCLSLAIAGHRRRVWLTLLGVAAAVPLFMSGSRGPVLAAVISLAIIAALSPASGTKRFVRIFLIAAGGALTYLYVQGSTTGGAGRIASTLLQGSDQDTSSQVRLLLWRYTSSYILGHPWGTGWGGLQYVKGFNLLNTEGLIYPHNVLLEVTGEAGWIAGAAAIFFLWSGLRHLRAAAVDPFPVALFGIAVFFIMNAMVSGDVNDNRCMWASVAVGWVVASMNGPQHASQKFPADEDIGMALKRHNKWFAGRSV
jgi:O-antigen ligase